MDLIRSSCISIWTWRSPSNSRLLEPNHDLLHSYILSQRRQRGDRTALMRRRFDSMSTFPGSPRLLKGGIALLDPTTGAVRQILPLQYNPDTLTRNFKIKGVGAESGDHIEALRLTGPPAETIKV